MVARSAARVASATRRRFAASAARVVRSQAPTPHANTSSRKNVTYSDTGSEPNRERTIASATYATENATAVVRRCRSSWAPALTSAKASAEAANVW